MFVGGHRSSDTCLLEYFSVVGAVESDLQFSKVFCATNSSPQKKPTQNIQTKRMVCNVPWKWVSNFPFLEVWNQCSIHHASLD